MCCTDAALSTTNKARPRWKCRSGLEVGFAFAPARLLQMNRLEVPVDTRATLQAQLQAHLEHLNFLESP